MAAEGNQIPPMAEGTQEGQDMQSQGQEPGPVVQNQPGNLQQQSGSTQQMFSY